MVAVIAVGGTCPAHGTTTPDLAVYSCGEIASAQQPCRARGAPICSALAARGDLLRPAVGKFSTARGETWHGRQGRRSSRTPEILNRTDRAVGGRARRDIRRHPRGLCRGEICRL